MEAESTSQQQNRGWYTTHSSNQIEGKNTSQKPDRSRKHFPETKQEEKHLPETKLKEKNTSFFFHFFLLAFRQALCFPLYS